MLRSARRTGRLALIGIVGFGATACNGSETGSASTATKPTSTAEVGRRDSEAALAIVEEEFGGCGPLGIDVMGGSTVFRPSFAERMVRLRGRSRLTREAVRPDADAVVVVLRALDMFLVEPGDRRPVAFNDAAEVMLREARDASDGCGASATRRYAYQAPRPG